VLASISPKFLCGKYALPSCSFGGSAIINTASSMAIPPLGAIERVRVKPGVAGLTRSMAWLGPRNRVNAISQHVDASERMIFGIQTSRPFAIRLATSAGPEEIAISSFATDRARLAGVKRLGWAPTRL
jgi:hypothetical protein